MTTLVEKHFLHRGHGLEFEMEVAWIRRQLPRGEGPMVDLGCGIGALVDILGRDRAIGIDCNAIGLRHTAARLPGAKLLCASVERLPFPDRSLEAITAQHLIEHLSDGETACCEWFRVLRPGGSLLLLTPNAAFIDPSIFADATHARIFRSGELGDLVRGAGFDIIDLRTIGVPFFRDYKNTPGFWRARRFVTHHAHSLSAIPGLGQRGQTLCCAARRPIDS